jgi:hypothetical protein
MSRLPSTVTVLKQDVFGRVERLTSGSQQLVRRVACGNGVPGTGLVARWLLRRERAALQALAGCAQVPQLVDDAEPGTLRRTWCDGEPLWRATSLPRDFFDRLADLVRELHARGVCHNDLHKENNILVGADGRPAVIDFQLASVHRRRGRRFARRCREDLRHVDKHRARYDSEGRERGDGRSRSWLAALWASTGKRIYNFATRRLRAGTRGEPRRPRGGPWPVRTPPLGP